MATARAPPPGDQAADWMPPACTMVRARPGGWMSRTVFPLVTASRSAAGLQPISPPPAATWWAPLPSPAASHTVPAGAAGLAGVPVKASHRPSAENTGPEGVIPGAATRRSAPVAPSSTHSVPREMNASSPCPANAPAFTVGADPAGRGASRCGPARAAEGKPGPGPGHQGQRHRGCGPAPAAALPRPGLPDHHLRIGHRRRGGGAARPAHPRVEHAPHDASIKLL